MLDILYSYLDTAWQAVAAVGWYIVVVGVVLLYLKPKITEELNKWKRKKDDAEYAEKYHKNPDVYNYTLARMEAARRRMQEKYARDAEIAREKELERIERKKQALLDLTDGQHVGQRLGQQEQGEASTSGSKSNSKSNSLKQEYNPLIGESSRGYRAPKRSCCGKGGCG